MAAHPTWRILTGDCRDLLGELEDESVHCVVTSPPYFGLRDYGTGEWEGGDPACDHRHETAHQQQGATSLRSGRSNVEAQRNENFREACGKCGARRVDRQIGLEPTPDEFVAALVDVFRGVRRVLRDDGTVWLNLGDSYAGGGGYSPGSPSNVARQDRLASGDDRDGAFVVRGEHNYTPRRGTGSIEGAKPKDLLGVPWLVAFALRADGWYLRSDIVWSKPNPMPESVTDRPTKAHEYVFLLSKGPRYFYDADAIREEGVEPDRQRADRIGGANGHTVRHSPGAIVGASATRNRRSVWTVATQPYAGAHFATFPPKLIEPCILAGTPERACGKCGAPWVRVVERGDVLSTGGSATGARATNMDTVSPLDQNPEKGAFNTGAFVQREHVTVGFEPSCEHGDGSATGVVLDPFAGAGTTIMEALRRGRSAIGLELNPEYAEQARQRVRDDAPLFNMPAELAS